MKEFSIEQKAKAYDEALERAKNLYGKYCINNVLESLFPELAESEDERIRKELIELLNDLWAEKQRLMTNRKDYERYIAWLEKQGQKPTDKLEPKFKVGDWIMNDYCVGKVIELTDDAYLLDTEQGIPFSCEHNAHLWTIQDAKDGDVLDANGAPFIYKKHDKDYVYFYCGVNLAGEFIEANGIDTWNNNNKVYPATKQQRDLLFRKMHEARYEWDADKKELKINDFSKHLEYNPDAPSIIEHKLAWSEEDEEMLRSIMATCELAEQERDSSPARHLLEMQLNWLKSIKQRVGE